jgi:DNA-binding HxlR family transcriptional regulator
MPKKSFKVIVSESPIMRALQVVGGKWKIIILFLFFAESSDGVLRYSELVSLIPSISPRVLVEQLRDLEKDGMVSRKVYQIIPPKVEYSLTELGKKFSPVMDALHDFAHIYKDAVISREQTKK